MDTLTSVRAHYAAEIEAVANLKSASLVHALATVHREKFLGPGPWDLAIADPTRPGKTVYRKTADADPRHVYHNVLIAIDAERELNNGHPATLSSCLDALSLADGEIFLHVGCGAGYYTGLAAEMVGPRGKVHAVEIDPDLAERAERNLRDVPNVSVHSGDGAVLSAGPCDAILVNAGFTHPLPVWLGALRPGGRLLMPITMVTPPSPISMGGMVLFTRTEVGIAARPLMPIGIFASPTGRDETLNVPIRQAFTTGAWYKIKSLRQDIHEAADTCCLHMAQLCLSSDPPLQLLDRS